MGKAAQLCVFIVPWAWCAKRVFGYGLRCTYSSWLGRPKPGGRVGPLLCVGGAHGVRGVQCRDIAGTLVEWKGFAAKIEWLDSSYVSLLTCGYNGLDVFWNSWKRTVTLQSGRRWVALRTCWKRTYCVWSLYPGDLETQSWCQFTHFTCNTMSLCIASFDTDHWQWFTLEGVVPLTPWQIQNHVVPRVNFSCCQSMPCWLIRRMITPELVQTMWTQCAICVAGWWFHSLASWFWQVQPMSTLQASKRRHKTPKHRSSRKMGLLLQRPQFLVLIWNLLSLITSH